MIKTLNLRITGLAPLVMHNGQLADPLNNFSRAIKAVSGKRQKTDADLLELGRLEFMGSLYVHDGAVCIHGEMLEACLLTAARKVRKGKQASAGLYSDGRFAIEYDGPKDFLSLWEDERFRLRVAARVGQVRVMRTRPIFRSWACNAQVDFNAELVNEAEVMAWAETAGSEIGLGDWRPRFGRFAVEKIGR